METAPLEARNSFFKRTRNNSGSQSRHSNKPKSSSSRSFLKRRGYGQLDSDDESAFPEDLSLSCDVTPTLNDAICPALFASSPHEEPLLTGSPEADASNEGVPVFEAPPPIPARQMKHSSTSSRDSPVPALPRPPQSLSRRQNSRKDRKNSQKRPPVRQISLGEQIFPLDEIHRLPVDLSNLNNPFSSGIRPIGASATFDSLYNCTSSKIKNSSSYVDNSWSVPVTCSPEKDGSKTSEDGSSLLLPNSSQKNCAGIANFSISEGEVFSDEHEFEPEEKEEAFSSDSDFEVADLDLSTEPVSTEGNETATEYGSTNNLAQFEPEVPMSIDVTSETTSSRPRPNSLNLPHDLLVSGEKMSPETPTPCSKGSTNDTLHSSGGENYGVDYLLQSLDDNENEMTVDARNEQPSSFSGFVKLKRSRKPRIKARQWVPVQISIADKSVLLFSEDGRLVEEVDIHADQNVSAIQVERSQDNCNSMPIYVVKLLRCFYKAKKLVGIGSAKSFSDLQSTNSVYEKYATKVNQILKVGLHDYLSAHSFASLLSKAIKTSELASEDVEILASPVCRLIVDVFDEINCEINEQMEICAANSSVETAIEVLAFSVDSARFELSFADFDQESESVTISPANFRMHPLAIPPENEKYSYEESRAIQICPVNTARMEILRFNSAFESFNLPILLKVDYTISAKNFSVACSLHFDEMQNVAALQNVTIHLPMATSCSKFSSENWFISNTVGKWKMEGNWLIWSIDSLKLSNQETKQQFLSAACRGSNSEKIPSQVALLQYEQLNETAASKTRIKHDKIDLQSQRSVDDDATVINYRSKYYAKVWIRLN